jgi:REP element-mobilizing transposase RayT
MSTHQQLLYHIVFSTKNRQPWLTGGFRENIFAYMAGVTRNLDAYALQIGGYYDHVHILARIPARLAVAEFVGKVKANTSKHVNESQERIQKFGWQDGYGAFTVSVSQQERIRAYIANQTSHHAKLSFQDEYLLLLKRHGIDYDAQYVFE